MQPLSKEQRRRKAVIVEDSVYDAIGHADTATNLLTDLLYSDIPEPKWEEICKRLEYVEQYLASATVKAQEALREAKSLRDR